LDNTLELSDVTIAKDGAPLLQVSETIKAGEILTIMGPSGVGKSTLLAYMIGTLAPVFEASGKVILNGNDITKMPPHQRRVGILFQDDLLFPHLSVGANLAFGLRTGGTKSERQSLVDEALREVGLEAYADRDPATLSGGQRARVGLMRTLLAEPCALLLDEAFSRLDAGLRDQVRKLVFQRARDRQLPVVMVTHDADDAKAAGGKLITLGAG
jgi:putative thiamine transport system ATP-binding protein